MNLRRNIQSDNNPVRIFVRVKPNSKIEKVEALDVNHFKVSVNEPAKEGRANWGVIRVIAR